MTYPRAYIAVAINNFKIVEWLALQIERDFSTVTASLIHFLGHVDIGWIWNVWWFIGRLKSSAVVHIDLQWLRVKIMQGAGLEIIVSTPDMDVANWHSDIDCNRWLLPMLLPHHRRAAIRAELYCVRAVFTRTLRRKNMFC